MCVCVCVCVCVCRGVYYRNSTVFSLQFAITFQTLLLQTEQENAGAN